MFALSLEKEICTGFEKGLILESALVLLHRKFHQITKCLLVSEVGHSINLSLWFSKTASET